MRASIVLFSAALLSAGGCSKSAESLIGSIDQIASVEGELFSGSPSKSVPIRGSTAEAQTIARILIQGKSCEHLKYQGSGYFTLICKDGRKIGVELMKPNIIEISDNTFIVDMTALMSLLQSLAK